MSQLLMPATCSCGKTIRIAVAELTVLPPALSEITGREVPVVGIAEIAPETVAEIVAHVASHGATQ